MTHPIEVKAAAWAQLLTGDSVAHVARRTGVPKQTISRWKKQAFRFQHNQHRQTARGRQFLAEISVLGPALKEQQRAMRRDRMGYKKRRARRARVKT
jgi:hypothetical protein